MIRTRFSSYGCIAAWGLVALTGCATTPDARQAWNAEKAGEYALAYERYCAAAEDRPGNAQIAAAIRRVAPLAARHWEQNAHTALDRGESIRAWRMFMRVLEIQPDHPSAAQLVRRIERDHPAETRLARAEWMQSNRRSQIASAEPNQEANPASPEKPRTQRDVKPEPSTDTSKERRTEPPVAVAVAPPEPVAEPPLREAPVMAKTPPVQTNPTPQPIRRDGVRHRILKETDHGTESDYLARRIISRDDDRYEKKVYVIDGITIKLDDTDDDPLEADLDVYIDDERVAKHRHLPVGAAVRVVGRSGTAYRLVVLTIRDRTETVIFGIMGDAPGTKP
jgi:tetratricopeptide (TPR) repeat protein